MKKIFIILFVCMSSISTVLSMQQDEKPYVKRMKNIIKKGSPTLKELFLTNEDKQYFSRGDIMTKLGAISLLSGKQSEVANVISTVSNEMKSFIETDFADDNKSFQVFWESVQEKYILKLINNTKNLRLYEKVSEKLSDQAKKKIAQKWMNHNNNISGFKSLVKSQVSVGPFIMQVLKERSLFALVVLLDNLMVVCKQLFNEFTNIDDINQRIENFSTEEKKIVFPKDFLMRLRLAEELVSHGDSECFHIELKNDLNNFIRNIEQLVSEPKSLKEMTTKTVCSFPLFLNWKCKVENTN